VEFVVGEAASWVFVVRPDPGGAAITAHRIAAGRRALAARVGAFREALAQRDLAAAGAARRLYDLLLGPAGAELRGVRRLLVIPDGPLWDLAFAALQPGPGQYLVERHALALAPSLTALREMAAARPAAPAGPSADARGAAATSALPPLPQAEEQVRALARMYGPAHGRAYVGPEAREERAKAEMGRYDLLHFATHGVFDDASPMYSTAGEGLIGLTWAFFVAGCPSSVVSLWKVDAASTNDLMVALHRHLRAGRGKDQALRQAALGLLRGGRFRHPFYWAGFVLVGRS
jgi:CHAT domain-containing protein